MPRDGHRRDADASPRLPCHRVRWVLTGGVEDTQWRDRVVAVDFLKAELGLGSYIRRHRGPAERADGGLAADWLAAFSASLVLTRCSPRGETNEEDRERA